ncbi:MAG: hypothetical protein ACRCS8_05645 [Brevinema sp.]
MFKTKKHAEAIKSGAIIVQIDQFIFKYPNYQDIVFLIEEILPYQDQYFRFIDLLFLGRNKKALLLHLNKDLSAQINIITTLCYDFGFDIEWEKPCVL